MILPCYNQGPFLREAIDSVLAQSVSVRQIIVVDDGSSDDTRQIATAYPAVRYLAQRNQGVSAARNAGLRLVESDYVVFLDADDRLLPEAIAIGQDHMDRRPECAFTSGRVRLIDSAGTVTAVPENSCTGVDHYRQLLTHNYIWTPAAVMFRTAVLHRVSGYCIKRFGAEDWELYLRIARQCPIHCHSAVVADYRTGGVMSADAARMLGDCLAALRAQRPFIRGRADYEDACKRGVSSTQRYYGDPLVDATREAIRRMAWREAARGVATLLVCYPRGLAHLLKRGTPDQ